MTLLRSFNFEALPGALPLPAMGPEPWTLEPKTRTIGPGELIAAEGLGAPSTPGDSC